MLGLGRWGALKVRVGGVESFSAADLAGEIVVLAGQCANFLDDPTWYLFGQASAGGPFLVRRLGGAGLARLARDEVGRPLALTLDGEVWTWNSRRWLPRGLAAGLGRCLDRAGVPRRRAVQMALAGPQLRCVVRAWAGDEAQRSAWGSDDAGRTWSVPPLGDVHVYVGWVPSAG